LPYGQAVGGTDRNPIRTAPKRHPAESGDAVEPFGRRDQLGSKSQRRQNLLLRAGGRATARLVGVFLERTTCYTMLCQLPQKDDTSVREAFTPPALRHSRRVSPQPHLGSRQREVPAQDTRIRARIEGLFLPPPQTLGTRHLRKPERPHPPLPAQRHRPRFGLLSVARRLSGNAQRAAA